MLRPISLWWRLPAPERWLFARLYFALPLVSLSMRSLGTVRTARLVQSMSGRACERTAVPEDFVAAERLAELAALAGRRGPLRTACLGQALVVEATLRRRGFAPKLKIGVRKQAGGLDAHAWVELQGTALGQGELPHTPFGFDNWTRRTKSVPG